MLDSVARRPDLPILPLSIKTLRRKVYILPKKPQFTAGKASWPPHIQSIDFLAVYGACESRRTIGGHAELSRSKIRGPCEVLQARDGLDVAVRDPNALKTRFCPTSGIVDILSIRGVDPILENGGNEVGPLPGSEIEHHK